MTQGWQALRQFEQYTLECIGFAYGTKQTMLSQAMKRKEHADNMVAAQHGGQQQGQPQEVVQSTRKRPLEFEEGNLSSQSKRRKYRTAHDKLETHDSTRDSSRETTEGQPTDAVWLCGEGQ